MLIRELQMATYSPEQIERYFEHIGLPSRHRTTLNSKACLGFAELNAVHVYQISTFPYDNLSLHYNASDITRPIPSLDPQELYDKLVTQNRGRGGYCFELATFYYHILRTLGFRVYRAGVRIRLREDGVPQGDYIGR